MRASIRIAIVLIVGFFTFSLIAQNRREDQSLPDNLYEIYKEKTLAIEASILKSKKEWAGTYLAGDHHPTVFSFEPEGGFIVSSSHHTFAPSWINYGKITIADSSLRIHPELDKENPSAHIMPLEFKLIRWGSQHFLIAPAELRSFAYAVHARDESSIVQYFARAEDRDKPRRGLPDLPSEFLSIMRMAPVRARITAVGAAQGFEQTITIGAGSNQKVGEGMFFYFSSKDGYQFSIRISEVSLKSAKGQVWSTGQIGDSGRNLEIKVGQKLSSRMPFDFVQPG